MKLKFGFTSLALVIFLGSCANKQISGPGVIRQPSSISAQDFTVKDHDIKFENFSNALDLEGTEYTLEYKSTGTSVGFKLLKDKDKVGKWVPPNSATDLESQVVYYELSKFFEMNDIVVPSTYFTIKTNAIAKFKKMLEGANEKNKWRKINRDASLTTISKNPHSFEGVLTAQVKNDAEAIGVADSESNTINSSHKIAQFIRADGPMPSKDKEITLKGLKTTDGKIPKSNELALAREFSKIMVVDILTGQWDRWSGGNVEAKYDKKTLGLHFSARDNGGGSMMGTSHLNKYFGIVTRFDKKQIQKVELLLKYLKEDPNAVAKAIKLRSNTKHLLARVEKLLEHVKEHGEKAFFPE